MRAQVGSFRGKGKLKLFYESWLPPNSKAHLVFVHGLSEHTGRYQYPIDYFGEKRFSLSLFDLRGHGQSEGERVYADSLDDFLADIDLFLERISREEKQPIFLIGHSFGGQLVLNYIASPQSMMKKRLAGFLLSSPNIRLVNAAGWLKVFTSGLLARAKPMLLLPNNIEISKISHNQEVVRAYREDPLVPKKITTRLGHLIIENQRILPQLARQIKTACFLMHAGDDRICDPKATREFFKEIPIEDKQLKIYKGCYHELFNEPERETVFKDMEDWIEKHL